MMIAVSMMQAMTSTMLQITKANLSVVISSPPVVADVDKADNRCDHDGHHRGDECRNDDDFAYVSEHVIPPSCAPTKYRRDRDDQRHGAKRQHEDRLANVVHLLRSYFLLMKWSMMDMIAVITHATIMTASTMKMPNEMSVMLCFSP